MAQRRCANRLEDEILYNRQLIAADRSLRIAVVGHAAATRCLLQYILGFDEQYIWKMSLDNTSISRFRFNRAGWFPIAINDTAHLRGASYVVMRPKRRVNPSPPLTARRRQSSAYSKRRLGFRSASGSAYT